MQEPVDDRGSDHRVAEDLAPLPRRLRLEVMIIEPRS